MPPTGYRPRVRAPELVGRRWLNTGGRSLSLANLRGRFALLDFWTFCCVNCLHVLDELRPLEQEFGDVLVTVGVHSPKFAHEADPDALEDAVERYDVRHPVLDDPDLATWSAYAARAWPTLVLVDPEGYVVAQMSGEGHVGGLRLLLADLVRVHEQKGTLRRGDAPYVPPPVPDTADTALRFPGKVVALPAGAFLVSDTAHHQLVELEPDLETELRRIGSGRRGLRDGSAAEAELSEPQGLAVLPSDVADDVGYDVVLADSVNHCLRGVRLATGEVLTVAGTGRQLRVREGGGPALEQDLSTPWDVAWHATRRPDGPGAVVVAMAGVHQLWAFVPARDPARGTLSVLAGTSEEGLRDGAAEEAALAQPSGLVEGSDGTLWFVDSETSSLRRLSPEPGGGERVDTVVGTGLFDFGHVDGPVAEARFQHPLGLAELPDTSVVVADTYNGAVRRYDRAAGEVTTLVSGLAEPSDVVVDLSGDDPVLVVVESAAHRLVRVPIPAVAQRVAGEEQRTQRPPIDLAPGAVHLEVAFMPPVGQKLDDRFGDPTRLVVSASPAALLLAGAGSAVGLSRPLEISGEAGDGVLHVSVQAAACDGDPETGEVPEHAACHLYQQDWGIPVRVGPDGAKALRLDLRGV